VYGRDEAIRAYSNTGDVTINGGLVLVDGTDVTSTVFCNGIFDRQDPGIVAAFDRAQSGPLTAGTHDALASYPTDALVWAIQNGHGGVTYGDGLFLDMGVTVAPPAPTFIPVTGGITDVPASMTAVTPLALTGAVAPADATNQTIVWSVKDAGGTDATIETTYIYVNGGLQAFH
jgi:hypothetical protein